MKAIWKTQTETTTTVTSTPMVSQSGILISSCLLALIAVLFVTVISASPITINKIMTKTKLDALKKKKKDAVRLTTAPCLTQNPDLIGLRLRAPPALPGSKLLPMSLVKELRPRLKDEDGESRPEDDDLDSSSSEPVSEWTSEDLKQIPHIKCLTSIALKPLFFVYCISVHCQKKKKNQSFLSIVPLAGISKINTNLSR